MPPFTRVTQERYHEMLEVLPPEVWTALGFLVGEPCDFRRCNVTGAGAATFDAFFAIGGEYYAATEALTKREFAALTPALVLANMVPGVPA